MGLGEAGVDGRGAGVAVCPRRADGAEARVDCIQAGLNVTRWSGCSTVTGVAEHLMWSGQRAGDACADMMVGNDQASRH
jgi:hypothetical protein